MRTLVALATGTLCLTGCAGANSDFVGACPVPVLYTTAQMLLAAAEIAAMPVGSFVADTMIPDYARLRDAAWACAGGRP